MNENKKKRLCYSFVGIGGVLSVIAGLTIGVILYLSSTNDKKEELVKLYGRIRILKVKETQLDYQVLVDNITLTDQIKKTIDTSMENSFQHFSKPNYAFQVTWFSDDQIARLVNVTDLGVFTHFTLNATKNSTLEKIQEFLEKSFIYNSMLEVELNDLEIQATPFIEMRSFSNFESFLSEKNNLNLNLVKGPNIKSPEEHFESNIFCSSLKFPSHGSISPVSCTEDNNNTLSSTCEFTCNTNYFLVGPSILTCLSSGEWSDLVPICKAKCLSLPRAPNVEISPESCFLKESFSGTRCFYYCEPGNVLEGKGTRICKDDGQWSGMSHMCKKTCSPLSIPEDGEIWPSTCSSSSLLSSGSICSFSCLDGFTLAGSPTLLCDRDGSWNFVPPFCRRGCPPLISPSNGEIFPPLCTKNELIDGRNAVVMEGVVCLHTCFEGYKMEGTVQRLCGAGGSWSGNQVHCIPICKPLTLPPLLYATPTICSDKNNKYYLTEGQKCLLNCPEGYYLSGDAKTTVCLSNQTWEPEVLNRCLRGCVPLHSPTNGMMAPEKCYKETGYVAQTTTCHVLCSDGFSLRGLSSVKCQTDGSWTGSPGKCLKRCPVLIPPSNSLIFPFNCSTELTFEGEQCSYVCEIDYGLHGNKNRLCQSDGTWSGYSPTCEAEKQFMIRQTYLERDICLDVNLVTGYVEKQKISNCLISNRNQLWTILASGLIENVGLRKCLSGEYLEEDSHVMLKECDVEDLKQAWIWEDDNGVSITLSSTNLQLGYGHASIGKVILTSSDLTLPWYAVSSDGIHSLYDMFSNTSCTRLHLPLHANILPSDCYLNQTVNENTICHFVCLDGRKLIGDKLRFCNSGKWTATYPYCVTACPALSSPVNGNVTTSCQNNLQDEGIICAYSCLLTQYKLIGDISTTCLSSGSWSSPPPHCALQCKSLLPVPNGIIFPATCTHDGSSINDVCQLQCQLPFMVKNVSELTCLSNGNWSSGNISCQRGCPNILPPVGDNGVVKCSNSLVWQGDICNYTCGSEVHRALAIVGINSEIEIASYTGVLTRECMEDGLFNGSLPMCVSVCFDIPSPANGALEPLDCTINTSKIEGTVCKLKCDVGYGPNSTTLTTCQHDGTWSNTNLTCTEQTQFYIIHQATIFNSSFCLQSLLTESSEEYYVSKSLLHSCYNNTNSLWSWQESNQLSHVESGLCLSIQDSNAKKSTLLVLKQCSEYNTYQRWTCTSVGRFILSNLNNDFYVTAQDTKFLYGKAYRNNVEQQYSETWLGINAVNQSLNGSICSFHTNKCAPFEIPHHSTVIPMACSTNSLVEHGTICHVECDEGFLIYETLLPTTDVHCSNNNQWKYEFEWRKVVECVKPCPPLVFNPTIISPHCKDGVYGVLNQFCQFYCSSSSLTMIGESYSVCGVNGGWSGAVPSCVNICSHPTPTNKNFLTSINCAFDEDLLGQFVVEDDVCYYECMPPYYAKGVLQRTCLGNQSFDNPIPTCHIPPVESGSYDETQCPDAPPHPQTLGKFTEQGLCVVAGNFTRFCAWYECITGYKISTNNVIHCLARTYTWPTPPSCKRLCPDISDECTGMTEGEICYVNCEPHFTLSHGNGRLTCNADGGWSDTMPYCVYKQEFQIRTALYNGNELGMFCLSHNGNVVRNPAVNLLNCSEILESNPDSLWSWEGASSLRHSGSSYCLSASTGSNHGSRIEIHECNIMDQLQLWTCSENPFKPFEIKLIFENLLMVAENLTFEVHLAHPSLINYEGKGGDVITPMTSWVSTLTPGMETYSTLCSTKLTTHLCPPLAGVLPPGGRLIPSVCGEQWSDQGAKCEFSCEENYIFVNKSAPTTTCRKEGTWSVLEFDCLLTCSQPFIPQHGAISYCSSSTYIEETYCNFTCEFGYELVGSHISTCQWNGRWSHMSPTCTKFCKVLPIPDHSTISPNQCHQPGDSIKPGTVCLLQCNEGYLLSSITTLLSTTSSTLTCYENGTWSDENVICTRVCPALPNFGLISPIICSRGESRSGFICTVQCHVGYIVHGESSRECLEDGTWKNSVTDDFGPVCRLQCPSFQTPSNSELICDDHSTTHHSDGATCIVQCHPGYGLSAKGGRTQKCVGNKWKGEQSDCDEESQFLMFLLKRVGTSQRFEVCLSVNEDDVVEKISHEECMEGDSPNQRWAWYDSNKLKNAVTGKCLSVNKLESGQQLLTSACDPVKNHTTNNQWSCNGVLKDGSSWFLRIADSNFYPDYGFTSTKQIYFKNIDDVDLSTDNIRWYARSYSIDQYTQLKNSPPITVCAMRTNFGVCPELIPPQHGSVYPTTCTGYEQDITSGLKCKFECEVGYKIRGSNVITCQNNGVWSETIPQCSILCKSLNSIPHGKIYPSSCTTSGEEDEGVRGGESCSMECDVGWRLEEGSSILTCMMNGEWNTPQPTCKRICQVLSESDNADVIDPTCLSLPQIEGKVCSFTCHNGFGIPRIKSEEFCENKTDTIENCELTTADSLLFDKQGYDITVHLSCLSDGSWSGEEPSCLLLCPSLLNPLNGLVTPTSCVEQPQIPGTICTSQCFNTHFLKEKSSNVTCTHGKWIPTKQVNDLDFDINIYKDYVYKSPTCGVYCSGFKNKYINGSILSPPSCIEQRNAIGTVCKLTCRSEFVLKGVESIECLEEGQWSEGLGTCIKKCPAITFPLNGEVRPLACTTASMGDGAICTFACLDKYYLEGEVTSTCNSVGKWSSPSPICKRRCQPQNNFYNGYVYPVTSCYTEHITVGEKCVFACFEGFVLEGNKTLECQSSGKWSSEQPTCNRICPVPFIENGAIFCNIKGVETEIYQSLNTTTNLTGGASCHVVCEPRFSPDQNSKFICRNDGVWKPAVPQCIETGVPMYILQNIGGESVCLLEHNNLVIQLPQDRCLEQSNYSRSAAWHWLGNSNIQNAHSGKCMGVRSNSDGEKLRVILCDTLSNLQHWECSLQNPFQLLLKGTTFSPTTYYRNLKEIVIQKWDDVHSYYSTFDLNTFTLSSLCSRRPGSDCLPITLIPGVEINPQNCTTSPIISGQQCSFRCINPDIIPQGSLYTICMGNGLWSSSPPICEEMCDSLEDEVTYGAVYEDPDCVFDLAPVGKICKATCRKDFELSGNGERECLVGGRWSKIGFQCLPKCPAIFSIINGYINPIPCKSATCTFTCKPGYILLGLPGAKLYCLTNGKWSNPLPRCSRDTQFRIVAKQRFAHIEMCLTAPHDFTGHVTKLPCTSSKIADGSQLFKWTSDNLKLFHVISGLCLTYQLEKWGSVTLEPCSEFNLFQEFYCGISPGVFTYSLRTKHADFFLDVGSRVQMSASEYRDSSLLHDVVMETQYLGTSQWFARHYFGQGTVCSMRSNMHCSTFPQIQNSVVFPSDCLQQNSIVKNLVCTVKCNNEYTIEQTEKSVCLNDGTWTQPLPTCIGMYQCPAIKISNPALMMKPYLCSRGTSVSEGVTCLFTCSDEHRLIGNPSVSCNAEGVWLDYIPTCQLQCDSLNYVPGITVTPLSCHSPNNVPGSQCYIKCGVGFELIGSSVRTCMEDGTWSGNEASCLMFCNAMIPPSSGNLFPERCKKANNYNGNTCNIRCNDGFMLVGDKQLTCTNGVWSNEVPQCVPIALCPLVHSNDIGVEEVIYKDIINDIAVGEGTVITVKCKQEYKLNGPETRVCLITGQWEGGIPSCSKSCPPINLPDHGSIVPIKCGWTYQEIGSRCSFNCDYGWSLEGVGELVCKSNGEWSHTKPTCAGGVDNDKQLGPFFIQQKQKDNDNIICLKSNKDGMIVEIDQDCVFSLNEQISIDYQWRWKDLDSGLIESLKFPGFCWTPTRSESNFRLGLAPCNKHFTNQHFHCGDVSLRQYASQVGTENLWLAYNPYDNSIAKLPILVSTSKNYNLDWEGIEVKNSFLDYNLNSTNVQAICRQMCNETIELNEGYITSPGYPLNYPRNVICTWTIIARDRILRLLMSDVDIVEGKGNCDRDNLMIMEGDKSTVDSSHILATICGRSRDTIGPIMTLHGSLTLKFKSGNIDSRKRGFKARWLSEQLPAPLTDCFNSASLLTTNQGNNYSVSSRLVGGSKESIDKAPWQAVLYSSVIRLNGEGGDPLCGAAIIQARYALTAAHCVYFIQDQNSVNTLALGMGHSELWRITKSINQLFQSNISRSNSESGAFAYRISRLFVHENYNGEMESDIAILQTTDSITWSSSIYPICLNTPREFKFGLESRVQIPKTYCKLTGWGSEDDVGGFCLLCDNQSDLAEVLATIDIPTMSDRQCSRISSEVFGRSINTTSILCAGHFDGTRQSPCKGDSGGALACEWNGNYYVVGITGQQLGSCTRLNVPRYFARVSTYMDWIFDVIRHANADKQSRFMGSELA